MMRGLFLGRFQPFHKGHLAAIRESAQQVDELYVGIGSAQESGTDRNPYGVSLRVKMIGAATKGIDNLKIVEIPDLPGDDDGWVRYIESAVPRFDVVFTGNPETAEIFSGKGYEVRTVSMIPNVSGTRIREMIRNGGNWQSLVSESTVEIIKEMDDCIFCQVVNGEVDHYMFWQNENFCAFLDENPVNVGHSLIVPKKHIDYLFDLDDETYRGLFEAAKEVAGAIQSVTECRRVGVGVSGFQIPHVHLHVIPLNKEGDFSNSRMEPLSKTGQGPALRQRIEEELRRRNKV